MAKRLKDQKMPPMDRALRDAFEAIEAEPVPAVITDHLERLVDGPVQAEKPT